MVPQAPPCVAIDAETNPLDLTRRRRQGIAKVCCCQIINEGATYHPRNPD